MKTYADSTRETVLKAQLLASAETGKLHGNGLFRANGKFLKSLGVYQNQMGEARLEPVPKAKAS